jgi:GTP-binding protein HflX
LNSTKVILVTFPDEFSIQEAKSLVESSQSSTEAPQPKIVKVFTQKYLNHSQYGLGSGKAEEIKDFVKQSKQQQMVRVIIPNYTIQI